jgi:hypothetical protein
MYCLLLKIPRHVGDFDPRGAGIEILKVWHVGEFCVMTWHDLTWRGWGYSPPSPPPPYPIESCTHTRAFLPILGLISSLNFKT